MSRKHCLIQRVRTDFGTLYAQVDISPDNSISGINISSHSKHEDTSVDRALKDLSQAFRDLIDSTLVQR
jgi:hypothetical protein